MTIVEKLSDKTAVLFIIHWTSVLTTATVGPYLSVLIIH